MNDAWMKEARYHWYRRLPKGFTLHEWHAFDAGYTDRHVDQSHPWQRVATNFASDDDALAFITAAMKDGLPPLIDAGVGSFLVVINPTRHA